MSFGTVAFVVGSVVSLGTVVTGVVCLDRSDIRHAFDTFERTLIEVAPFVGIVGVALLIKQIGHGPSVRLSRVIDWNITPLLYRLEGRFVAGLQAATPDIVVPAFAAFYIFGFAYLVVTPVVLYFLGSSRRALKELLVAYALNYLLGLALYTLVIARGPRLYIDNGVDGLLFQMYPQIRHLTGAVSVTTNVFPSLHTSLSVIVFLFAWRTRRAWPRWVLVAATVTSGVVLSTMVLGIHWLIDVVAGVALAFISVRGAVRLVTVIEAMRDRS